MSQQKLKPFSIAGVLPACPECGATGDYDLLVKRIRAVRDAWVASGRYPDTTTDRLAIDNAIREAMEAIGMERAR